MQEKQNETVIDVQLEQLKNYIVQGFPKTKHECAELTHNFYDYRESFTIINGMVLKDKRIAIPMKLCDEALDTLHRSHMGIVKTKECESTCMFWPKMYADINEFLSKYKPCMTHKVKSSLATA